ncbi:S8 family serine peptidase [Paraburkholderia sp. BL18I3N2]|uniref:S8 family serine peptidase n=1 Tax=Paraburkholderia sp. BL18I3N2 TaxID=1938799 RepID=UPI0015E660FA|nr:S8 family serine peptidase [Paraburkholderia sp. BL18I3N2]
MSKVPEPDQPLGDRAYVLRWPGCPYVKENPNVRYVVKPGDTAFDVYKMLTGSAGTSFDIRKYFKTSGIADLAQLKPGQQLKPAHITAPTPVKATMNVDAFRSTFTNLAYVTDPKDTYRKVVSQNGSNTPLSSPGPSVNGSDDTAPASDPVWADAMKSASDAVASALNGPKFEIAAGHIESAATNGYDEPDECKGAASAGPIFDPARVSAAYRDAMDAVSKLSLDRPTTRVAVADNGFFGAHMDDATDNVKFGPQFPERLFAASVPDYVGAQRSDGRIGPVTVGDAGKRIYPINYTNHLTQVDVVSGHGTHVTGLIIGGPDFQPYLSVFDRDAQGTWMKLWIINVGMGGEMLIPNSVSELSNQMNMLSNSIVNLSIEYPPLGSIDGSYLLRFIDSPQQRNLFIVSAGNDGSPDVSGVPFFPAVLGGRAQANVISVAASLPDGRVARFSNRGRGNVDLAAPGCELPSWLDDSGQVSRISGTSQAAAVVTFAATLVRSLGDLNPIEIKNRLMISGDPLRHATDASSQSAARGTTSDPAPEEILSRSTLNVATSLYVFDDYVRYRDVNGRVREALGVIQGFIGVSCQEQIQSRNVWSLKKSDAGLLVFKGKLTPQQIIGEPCIATTSGNAQLRIKVRADIDDHGVPVPVNAPRMLIVPMANLDEYVSASKAYRAPL